jgi:hypothetical protein
MKAAWDLSRLLSVYEIVSMGGDLCNKLLTAAAVLFYTDSSVTGI